MAFTLIIGNKAYSSWSLRPWLLLAQAGIDFEEVRIPLYRDDSAAALARWSPSGRVPVLIDGELTIWESLAIVEYLAERFPAPCGWPRDPAARAVARAVSAEMHAGFAALRAQMVFNCRARRRVTADAAAEADVARIQRIGGPSWRIDITTLYRTGRCPAPRGRGGSYRRARSARKEGRGWSARHLGRARGARRQRAHWPLRWVGTQRASAGSPPGRRGGAHSG